LRRESIDSRFARPYTLEFSAPLCLKRLTFSIQAPKTWCRYLRTHRRWTRPRRCASSRSPRRTTADSGAAREERHRETHKERHTKRHMLSWVGGHYNLQAREERVGWLLLLVSVCMGRVVSWRVGGWHLAQSSNRSGDDVVALACVARTRWSTTWSRCSRRTRS
jgi:hypothetical protein